MGRHYPAMAVVQVSGLVEDEARLEIEATAVVPEKSHESERDRRRAGGLYFALLAKKAWPRWEVTVYERNRPDDTFGFGVVFSDQTLDTFKAYDLVTYERIRRRFAYWGDVDVVYKGRVMRSGGNGFCGCSRVALLNILQDRGRELGVQMRFQREVQGLEELADSDLIVVADGINSIIRSKYKEHFQPSVDLRPNKFTWLGSTRPIDAFKYFFRETPEGVLLAHVYQYEPDRSTWVIEMDEGTWRNFGFDRLSESDMLPVLERVFAEELAGHPLIANRSLWRSFPNITNKTWVKHEGNTSAVLIGDAKATAHFSIGSGTKLAMEDAVALFEAFKAASRSEEGFDAVRHRAARRGREDPARRQRLARVVRAPEALLGHGAAAVRLRRNVALQADHLGEPRAARPRVRARSPQVVSPQK